MSRVYDGVDNNGYQYWQGSRGTRRRGGFVGRIGEREEKNNERLKEESEEKDESEKKNIERLKEENERKHEIEDKLEAGSEAIYDTNTERYKNWLNWGKPMRDYRTYVDANK
jgi:hypothetical protein